MSMTKAEYKKARRLIRDNGYYALRWLSDSARLIMERLRDEERSKDKLAERASVLAYCKREGCGYNFRQIK